MREKKSRSVIKAVTYRTAATFATFTLAYLFTGSLEIAGQIGVLDFFVKFAIYYINERAWGYTNWGYKSSPSKSPQPEATNPIPAQNVKLHESVH